MVPQPFQGTLTAANTSTFTVSRQVTLDFKFQDRSVSLPVLIVPELNDQAIAGIDLISALGLTFDPLSATPISAVSESPFPAVKTREETLLQAFEAKPVKLLVHPWDASDFMATFTLNCNQFPALFSNPGAVTIFDSNCFVAILKNCSSNEIKIPRGFCVGHAEPVASTEAIDTDLFCQDSVPLPPPMSEMAKKIFLEDMVLTVPDGERESYAQVLLENYDVFSRDPNDFGQATHFEHVIQLKDFDPIFRKQFRIPDIHKDALETQVFDWLRAGVIEPCHSRYNTPIFVVPKKGGSRRFVLDYRNLNEASVDDRYSMKDVNECIGEIGRAGSTIFSTLDLTSGFYQLPLAKESRPLTAFTVPGLGQYQYKVLSMGLKGGPGSFQRMMELTCKGLPKVIVYIDDLLIHSATHEEHRSILSKTFARLRFYNLKLNLKKCSFGSTSVSYLGYRLTPQGIVPGLDKLQAIERAPAPTSVSQIRAFLGLCNFFRSHVYRYSQLAAPLIKLLKKDAGWKGPNLPPDALSAFESLKQALISEPLVAYPSPDHKFELYTDASTGSDSHEGAFGAVLAQSDSEGDRHVVAYASRTLQPAEKNYPPYLAEMKAAVWAINHFSNYLLGRKFTLFTDHKPLEKMGTVHTKSLNMLQETLSQYDFEIKHKPGNEMPADFLSRSFPLKVHAIDFNTADLVEAQASDPFCSQLIEFVKHKQLPEETKAASLVKRLGPSLFLDKKVLFRSHRDPTTGIVCPLLVLPNSLVHEAIRAAHGAALTGHAGRAKTKARLMQMYYWPRMEVDIAQFLEECLECQKAAKPKPPRTFLKPLPTCSSPNQRVHLDLFGPLKTPTMAKGYILCITDACTKYVEAVPISNKLAETVAQHVFDHWICRFGCPTEILTDGGSEFANKVSKELYLKLEISYSTTSPFHPQCNAQAEVVNKHFQKYLSRMCQGDTLHWEHLLPPMNMAYNSQRHESIGMSPAMAMFGFQPRLPGLIGFSLDESDNNLRLQALARAREVAHEVATGKSLSYTNQHDSKAVPLTFFPGQQVLLDVRLFPKQNAKLADKFEGPYFVMKIYPNNVLDILRQGKIHRVNMSRCKLFVPKDTSQVIHSDSDTSGDEDDPVSQDVEVFSPPAQTNDSHSLGGTLQLQTSLPSPMETELQQADVQSPDFLKPAPVDSKTKKIGRPAGSKNKEKPPPIVGQGPVTRSRSKIQSSIDFIDTNMSVSTILSLAKPQVTNIFFDSIISSLKSGNISSVTEGSGDCPFATKKGKIILDDLGMFLPKSSLESQAYLERRKYLLSLPPAKRNLLLTGDPLFAVDPTFYTFYFNNPNGPVSRYVAPHLAKSPVTIPIPETVFNGSDSGTSYDTDYMYRSRPPSSISTHTSDSLAPTSGTATPPVGRYQFSMRPSILGQVALPAPVQDTPRQFVPAEPTGCLPSEASAGGPSLQPLQDIRGVKRPATPIEPIPLVLDPFENPENREGSMSPSIFPWALPEPNDHFPLAHPSTYLDPELHRPGAEMLSASLEESETTSCEPTWLSSGDDPMPMYDPYAGKRKRSARRRTRPISRCKHGCDHDLTSSDEEDQCTNPRCGLPCHARPKSSLSHCSMKSIKEDQRNCSHSSSSML